MFEVIAWNGVSELVVDTFAERGDAQDRARELATQDQHHVAYSVRKLWPIAGATYPNGATLRIYTGKPPAILNRSNDTDLDRRFSVDWIKFNVEDR
jgi:hypothetical protein